MDKYEILKRYFGYDSFRAGQETLVDALCAGRDALGIMPTGGGKSICYQIPACLRAGLAIVISPLISLMKDQVAALVTAGISAAFLNSSLSGAEAAAIYRNVEYGVVKILYVAPERLDAESFLSLARRTEIALIAVDEAHCISQWGQDFRKSYLRIADFIAALPVRPPVAAFTATATEAVKNDILRALALRDPVTVTTGFDRPNLDFSVLQPLSKTEAVKNFLKARQEKSGIVYCSTRTSVDTLYETLRKLGYPVTRYHAGLSAAERQKNQDDFVYDRAPVMIATNAFGMGIDKSNVGFVIHYNMPLSMEAYYQEAGRAGRDGTPAECVLLYSPGDVETGKVLAASVDPDGQMTEDEKNEQVRRNLSRLYRMNDYCRTTQCLRGFIRGYFGERHPEQCDNCGNCRAVFREEDVTVDAQKIFSCIKRIGYALGYTFGKTGVAAVLRGSKDAKILSLGLERLSTYGIMKDVKPARLYLLMEKLEEENYIKTDPGHGGLILLPAADDVLFHGKKVLLPFKEEPPKRASASDVANAVSKKKKSTATVGSAADLPLYERLRRLRAEIAAKENVPAYIVFSNATLEDMVLKKPTSREELLSVFGVGAVRADRYGDLFLEEIRKDV